MNRETEKLIATWRDMGPVAWAESPYGWITEEGRPVELEPWQRAILQAWWAHRGEISTLAVSCVKKSGKTTLSAILTAWRFLSLPSLHICQANDLEQSMSRVFAMVAEMAARNPHLAENCTIGKAELIYHPTGSRLIAVSSDAASNAGANFSTSSSTECWGIEYEGAIRNFEELTPPPGKPYGFPNMRVVDSYSGFEGSSQLWHGIVDRGLKGKRISKEWPIFLEHGLMLFHAEGEWAREHCFRGTPEEAAEYYAEQQRTLRPNAFTRFHANQRTAAESQFLPEGAWQACYSRELRPIAAERVRLVLGADASTSRDFTSLVGTVYDEQTNTVDVKYCRIWKPQKIAGVRFGKPTVDIDATIGAEVLRMHEAGQVDRVICDNFQLHTCVIAWERAGIRVIELPQNSGRIEADQGLYDTVIARGLRHYNHPELNEAIKNAVAVETPRGFRLTKEKTSKKIDAAVALSMSAWGALQNKALGGPIQILPGNPFYSGPPISDYIEAGGRLVYAPKASHKPHPEGVTWQNCPKRTKGCEACIHELEAEGVYEKQEQELELSLARGAGQPLSADEAFQDLFGNTIERHQQRAREEYQNAAIVSKFWSNIRRELGSRDKGGL
jgi:phage terminase large subunit-like protein